MTDNDEPTIESVVQGQMPQIDENNGNRNHIHQIVGYVYNALWVAGIFCVCMCFMAWVINDAITKIPEWLPALYGFLAATAIPFAEYLGVPMLIGLAVLLIPLGVNRPVHYEITTRSLFYTGLVLFVYYVAGFSGGLFV